jgi:hypothetical protein
MELKIFVSNVSEFREKSYEDKFLLIYDIAWSVRNLLIHASK